MIRRLLLIFVIGVAGAAAVGDNMARVYAEHQIEQRADAYFDHTNGSSAHISSFPFVVNLLASGTVKHMDVSIYGATLEQLYLRRLTLKLDGVKLDRNDLLRRKVRLRDLRKGTVEVDVDGQTLGKRIGRDVRFHDGSVQVHENVAGRDIVVAGSVSVESNVLTFHPQKVEGLDVPGALARAGFTYRLPRSELFPCAATVRPIEGGVLVGCSIDHIPPGLVGDLSRIER